MRSALLMAAYQCGPGMGSVSQIGWEWYARMARRRPLWLITHSRNRAALEAAGAPLAGSVIHYIDTEWLAGPLYRLACRLFPGREHAINLISSLDYYLFDQLALRQARKWRRAGVEWSAVHVPTPVSSAAGVSLDKLGLPLLRGPLNCGLGNPQGFSAILQQEAQWLNQARALGRKLAAWIERDTPGRLTLSANQSTRASLPPAQARRSSILLENGIDPQHFRITPWPQEPGPGHALRVLYVGRMQAVKGVDLLLEAVARLIHVHGLEIELTLAGDGAMRPVYEAQAQQLMIDAHCHFTGNLPLQHIPALMQDCHVFCLPSVRESGGAVLLEAMACARPVIGFNFGGPAQLLQAAAGHLLHAASPAELIDQICAALLDCWRRPQHWRQMGQTAADIVRQPHPLGFCWEDKVDKVERLLDEMSQGRQRLQTEGV